MIDLSRYVFEAMRKEEDFILYRGRRKDEGSQAAFASYGAPSILGEADVRQEPRRSASGSRVLVLAPLAEYPAPEILKWLEHAYSLREELDPTWAARPIAITRHWDRTVLVLEDPGGVPLDQLPGQPLNVAFALRLAISLSTAIGQLHQRGFLWNFYWLSENNDERQEKKLLRRAAAILGIDRLIGTLRKAI